MKLLDSAATDVDLNREQRFVLKQLAHTADDFHPDAHACRLQVRRSHHVHNRSADKYAACGQHLTGGCHATPRGLADFSGVAECNGSVANAG